MPAGNTNIIYFVSCMVCISLEACGYLFCFRYILKCSFLFKIPLDHLVKLAKLAASPSASRVPFCALLSFVYLVSVYI